MASQAQYGSPALNRLMDDIKNDLIDTLPCTRLTAITFLGYLHKENKEPSLEKGTKWAKQIAMGMDHLHRNDLAHLDLKSLNVLLLKGKMF